MKNIYEGEMKGKGEAGGGGAGYFGFPVLGQGQLGNTEFQSLTTASHPHVPFTNESRDSPVKGDI